MKIHPHAAEDGRAPSRAIVPMLVALLTSPAVAADTGDAAAFEAAIRHKYDMKEAAFAANDPTPILERFYHKDVVSVGPDGHVLEGREALRPVYEEVIVNEVRIESYRSFVNGDAGWDWVNFHVMPSAESGEEPFSFKMLFLWSREEGEWWSHGEMYQVGEFQID